MTTKAKKAIKIGPSVETSNSFLFRAELVEILRVTFLSKRDVALRRRAALFPLGMI